tara:strand:+ start:692 stop:994 length:303 start_codon:yes stop_codon:yes gene_type:complete
MTTTTDEFLALLDNANSKLKHFSENNDQMPQHVNEGILSLGEKLQSLTEKSKNNELPRVSKNEIPKGTNLGLSQNVSVWCEDSRLMHALYDIDRYFSTKY